MMNFFKKEYKDRLTPLHTDDFISQFIDFGENPEDDILDVDALVDAVYKKGWDAYRAAVLEASYLDK